MGDCKLPLFLNLVNGVDRISEDKTSAAVLRKFVNTVYDIMRDVNFCTDFVNPENISTFAESRGIRVRDDNP